MVATTDALFVTGILVGLSLCALALYTYRRWDELGVSPFAAFLGVLGVGAIIVGVVSLLSPSAMSSDGQAMPPGAGIAYVFWGLSAIPWIVFALQYTGRYTQIRWRTIAFLFTPFLGFGMNILLGSLGVGGLVLQSLIGTAVFVYSLGLVLVGCALVLWTTQQYSHLSTMAGGLLTVGPVGLFFAVNSLNFSTQYEVLAGAVYVGGYGFVALVSAVALFGYDPFEATPAVGTIGEREITREIDDLVFVVDDHDRVIKCNEAVPETFETTRPAVLGDSLDALLDYDIETLRTRETVMLETDDGTRRYDTQVSAITDQHDRELGLLVSLHDVTEHELREQRLTVLNRVLRHNLRNKVEVIKGNAEVLEGGDEQRVGTIVDTADSIAELGQSARAIDKFVARSTTRSEVDLADAIDGVLGTVRKDGSDVSVSVDVPETATVRTTKTALSSALESAIDNAVTYADSAVEITVENDSSGYEISIADDGPGIPQSELAGIDAGTETALQHGTGLGLWQLKWAVRTMGGELEFDTSDGTTVTFTVPEQ